MDEANSAAKYLNSLLFVYSQYSLIEVNNQWSNFWKFFQSKNRLRQNEKPEEFVSNQIQFIAECLTKLGKDNPATKEFLSQLPLRYSKAVISWPNPTPEQIGELMSD